jgi:hypothetical protein
MTVPATINPPLFRAGLIDPIVIVGYAVISGGCQTAPMLSAGLPS